MPEVPRACARLSHVRVLRADETERAFDSADQQAEHKARSQLDDLFKK
jgi:hypothetical protein